MHDTFLEEAPFSSSVKIYPISFTSSAHNLILIALFQIFLPFIFPFLPFLVYNNTIPQWPFGNLKMLISCTFFTISIERK